MTGLFYLEKHISKQTSRVVCLPIDFSATGKFTEEKRERIVGEGKFTQKSPKQSVTEVLHSCPLHFMFFYIYMYLS